MATRTSIQAEAERLDDRKLTEKARTSRNLCTDWTKNALEAEDAPFLWTSDEEQADIDSTRGTRDQWCMMAEVYESELRIRRADRPSEMGETVASVDRRRAEERHEREERFQRLEEEALAQQRETSVVGAVVGAPGAVAGAVSSFFSPANWVGLGADQTSEERQLGAVRLALIAVGLVVAYYLIVRPAGGFFARQTAATSAMMAEAMKQGIPGV